MRGAIVRGGASISAEASPRLRALISGLRVRAALGAAMRKSTTLPHRNRKKSARHRAKLKNKLKKAHLRRSKGVRGYYK